MHPVTLAHVLQLVHHSIDTGTIAARLLRDDPGTLEEAGIDEAVRDLLIAASSCGERIANQLLAVELPSETVQAMIEQGTVGELSTKSSPQRSNP